MPPVTDELEDEGRLLGSLSAHPVEGQQIPGKGGWPPCPHHTSAFQKFAAVPRPATMGSLPRGAS